MWRELLDDRKQWVGYFVVVIVLHIVGFIGLWSVAMQAPLFVATGLLAYTLGLRHAFDADHIAAIDNTVRKLIRQKQNSLGVGFYFSLGHSSVVFLMVVVTAISMKWAIQELPWLTEVGGVIGATVSGSFLLLIGGINILVLWQLVALLKRYRNGQHEDREFEIWLARRGFFIKMLRPVFALVSKSWHVYPLGFLFGLGFDTASEITLLVISAGASQLGISIWGILALPVLFAAGMSLMDTADGIFMTKAYKWTFSSPLHKLYYNIVVTTITVVAALIIATVTLSRLLSEKLGWTGGLWSWMKQLDLGFLGYMLVGLFVLVWVISYNLRKYLRVQGNPNAKI